MNYQQRIKELRKENKKTQKEIADLLEVSQQAYNYYENGTRDLPIKHLIKLSQYYKKSTDYILGLHD